MVNPTQFSSSVPPQEDNDASLYAPEPEPEDAEISEEENVSLADAAEQQRVAAIEAEARRAGWRPVEEYRGAPGTWRSAEEFLARGREINPILQRKLDATVQTNTRLEGEVRELKGTVDRQTQQIQELLNQNRTADQRGYERARRELLKQQRDAAASGDVAAYDAVSEQISTLDEEAALTHSAPKPETPAPAAPQPQPVDKPLAPEVQDFLDANRWFMTDPILNEAMQAEHRILNREQPGLSLADNLEKAKQRVMDRYPSKFGRSPVKKVAKHPSVQTPTGERPGGGGTPTGLASIVDASERAEVTQAFRRAKAQDPDLTDAEFIAVYNDPRLDVFELRREQAAKRRK